MIDQVHRLALRTLRNHLETAGVEFREEDGDIVFNQHRLGLGIVFEGFAQQGPQRIAPVEIQIHLDGDSGDRFRVGVLGVGQNDEDAVRSAIEEWHVLLVVPLLAALGAVSVRRLREPPSLQIDGWDIYPGRAGIRGALPAGLEPGGEFFRQLVGAVGDTVKSWKTGDEPAVRIVMVMANAAGRQQEAQAAVDGFVDEKLTQRVEQLSWPAAPDAYFYKQVFVLRRAAGEAA
ncbi:MAG: DUF6348 family protein [Planctomycetota bacterium]|nr:DUF6348 family protein [Planctomycetota bacterium]